MAESRVTWDFAEVDGFWSPVRTPPADPNLLRAVETLVITLSNHPFNIRLFLERLDELASSSGDSGTVNTTAASVKKLGGGRFEICDKYGQFDNVDISYVELRAALSALLVRILADFPEAGQV